MQGGFTGVGEIERVGVGMDDEKCGMLAIQAQRHGRDGANRVFARGLDAPARRFQEVAHRISSIWRPFSGWAKPPVSVRFARGRK
ncbi:Uncharacterised protein [Bordetella pertussis]|nr:Uncharacterised protein [Bordetella pertussis]